PLPLDGRLYVLTEKEGALRLACLVPPAAEQGPPTIAWVQRLTGVRDRLLVDVSRRLQAVHLAYAEGVIVCPTHAGFVFGMDALTHAIVWANAYREPAGGAAAGSAPRPLRPGQPPALRPATWNLSAPVVAGDKVLLAMPDSPDLLCLGLHDGRTV